ncbi:MAG: thiamine-phosphate kinase [Deltaproteobacteria bacterium]|nr:MAG: thiamine-phosphate kinase [Deltaproteobacteria bacterium]
MTSDPRTIEDIGEFGFIRSINKDCIFRSENVICGIGDDCAVIGSSGNKALLVTTDMLVENVHFILDRIPPQHLGEKSIAVNLSDIAAMGGVPLHAFVSIAIPHSFPVSLLDALYNGMKAICQEHGVNVLGGDTSSSPAGLFISVTVIGEVSRDNILYRKGASRGDKIYVCGLLGRSAAGLAILKGDVAADEAEWNGLVEAHTRPRPMVREGRLIAGSGLASAMIDVSDGLAADLGHICEQSGVGAEVEEHKLPISADLRSFGETYGVDTVNLALSGGEDYCLLVTVPSENAAAFVRQMHKENVSELVEIGKIISGAGVYCIGRDGRKRRVSRGGFHHF